MVNENLIGTSCGFCVDIVVVVGVDNVVVVVNVVLALLVVTDHINI